jgi:hypothetical protein
VTRSYEFRATHHLTAGPAPEGLHGHRYHVEVTTVGARPAEVDECVHRLIVSPLHGRRITIEPATGEKIVEWIDARLRDSAIGPRLRAVGLRETDKNRFVSALTEDRYV